MTPKLWAVALLSVVSVPALFPDGAFALTAGQCEVFFRRGLMSDAMLKECCREHPIWAAVLGCTDAGFGGGSSQSGGFGGGGSSQSGGSGGGGSSQSGGSGGGNTVGDAQSAADALNTLNAGRSSPTGPGASQGSNEDRNADTSGAGAAQSVVDALNVLNSGNSPPTGPGAPQGSSGDRNANTRTPEQDYAVKKNPYFFEDKSKYPQ
ncbi:MAG: hypothetical protein WEB85_02060 [Dongiaceae bacterium]